MMISEVSKMYQLWWVDVETTGLDPRKDEIIEIALMRTDCDPSRRWLSPVRQKYVGLREPFCPISVEASKINGLTLKQLTGKKLDNTLIESIILEAHVFIAHNAPFDRSFLEMMFPDIRHKMWFCSMKDIEWKYWGFQSVGLQSLLRAHQIFPHRPHRAESDILSLYQLLQEHNPHDKAYFWEMWDRNYHQFLKQKEKPPQ